MHVAAGTPMVDTPYAVADISAEVQKYVKIPIDFIKAPQKIQQSSHRNLIRSSALHPTETFTTFTNERYLLQSSTCSCGRREKQFSHSSVKQNQKFILKLSKQPFLKDLFPLQLLLLGSNFCLSPRIREGLKGSLKAISILKGLTARSTTSSLFSCDDGRDIFLLSFQDVT